MNQNVISEVTIVTGLSGAGKTVAIRAFEDMGYHCIDNLPFSLLSSALNYFKDQGVFRLILGMDIRDSSFSKGFVEWLSHKHDHISIDLVFLTADIDTLLTRYSTTKRGHPLSAVAGSLEASLQMETRLLTQVSEKADLKIDTSKMTPYELKSLMENRFKNEQKGRPLLVRFESFGFKHGGNSKADFVVDVRILKNPFFEAGLSKKTGLSREVSEFIFSDPLAEQLMARMEDYFKWSLPLAYLEGKSFYHVGIGCTGGQHRSVAFAEDLGRRLAEYDFQENILFSVTHRDAHVFT